MEIISDIALKDFEFRSGAGQNAKMFTDSQMDRLEEELQDLYPNGIGETTLNDLFRFDADYLAELIGFETIEELEKYNKKRRRR